MATTRRKIRYETKNHKVGGDHYNDKNSKMNSHRNTKNSLSNTVNHPTDTTRPTVVVSSSSWWPCILHQTIECWIHQLLYLRQVYPPYTFVQQRQREEIPRHLNYPNATTATATTSNNTDKFDPDLLYLDFRNSDDGDYYHWNIHPQVNAYIQTVLRTAIPSLISGVSNELQFHIIQYLPPESDTDTIAKTGNNQPLNYKSHHEHQHPPYHILETYTIRMKGNTGSTTNHDNFHQHPQQHATTVNTIPLEVIQHVKDGMKHLIQSHIRTLECSTNTTPSNQINHSTTTTTTTTTTTKAPPNYTNTGNTTKISNARNANDSTISFQLVLHVPPLSSNTTTTTTTTISRATKMNPTGNPIVDDNRNNNNYYYSEKNQSSNNNNNNNININNNEIQQALQTGEWYTFNHYNPSPPVEEDHIIYIDDTDDDDDDDNMKHKKEDDDQKMTTTTTTTTDTNKTIKKTIRPIYSYMEDQYIGTQIQCSMLRYSTHL